MSNAEIRMSECLTFGFRDFGFAVSEFFRHARFGIRRFRSYRLTGARSAVAVAFSAGALPKRRSR